MTRSEWKATAHLIDQWFKGGFTEDREDAYFEVLVEFPAAAVLAALKGLLRSGSPFTPALSEIVQAMDTPPLTFDEVWPAIVRALNRGTASLNDSYVLELVEATAGPVARGWLATYGLDRMRSLPVNDPDRGSYILHQLRQSFTEMTATPDRRDRIALSGPRVGQLRRMNPVELLEADS